MSPSSRLCFPVPWPAMKLLGLLGLLAVITRVVCQSDEDESDKYVMPEGSPGFYEGQSDAAVTLDQHSLLLDGKRVMIFSGEFHPFRLPNPELWYDILEKFKAGGLNAVSIYWHWGLTAPNNSTLRFTEHNDVAKFYDIAKEVGVLVIARPGPYVNAETAGGGIPAWATNLDGLLRTNVSDYRAAWEPYIAEFARITSEYQYPDGPVIAIQSENEYFTSEALDIPGLSEHMQDIIDVYRENGLTRIPTIHNDKNAGAQFAEPGLGKVDLYGWDGYPLGFDCDQPEVWNELSTQHDANHQRVNPAEPLALFEWQGGAFSYWSGPSYEMCYQLINEQFANVFYKNNYAAGTAIQNLYMTYGGTNWGNMHTHTIYSSYDYGAAIAEDRTFTPKFDELKVQAYFLHSSPDYLLAYRVSNSTLDYAPEVYVTHLHSPDSGANFYFVRQATNTKTTDTEVALRVNSTRGEREVDIRLAGRESKIIVTDYPFGQGEGKTIAWTSAEIMVWGTFEGLDIIVLYALEGTPFEAAIASPGSVTDEDITSQGSSDISASADGEIVTLSGTLPTDSLSIFTFNSTRVFIVDKKTAGGLWAPHFYAEHNYETSPDILVQGPYLLRSATLSEGGTELALVGDINSTTTVTIWGAPSSVSTVTWNGEQIDANRNDDLGGALTSTLEFPDNIEAATESIPVLSELEWVCADSLPELGAKFEEVEGEWVVADIEETTRPQQPFAGRKVLYGSEYGFHAGQWVWRGHFSGNATGVSLSTQVGYSGGYAAWVNGIFLGSDQGTSISQTGIDILNGTFNFTEGMVDPEGDNVITVIHDSTGLNQDYNVDDEIKSPRGIRGYQLFSESGEVDFDVWKVAGNIGGENAPDAVRGPYNEGGWWFERVGAHLPGYDASGWNSSCSPLDGTSTAGVTVYRTIFELDFPEGSDIPLAFDFELGQEGEAAHRVLIYVNGWQFGRFLSTHGPQTSYPIPEGILNHYGSNEVLISVWALEPTGAQLKKLELNPRAVLASSKKAEVDVVAAPGWAELRG